jgi:UDP-N-acetylglucosamine transferase subunit ALG13
MLPHAELVDAIARADVVVSHSGIGSALDVLEAGKVPVLVPRRASRGEHVDDHQRLIARELHVRGLAVHRELDDVTWQDLCDVAGRSVDTVP